MKTSNISCFTERRRRQKTLTRLHMYIEAWPEITLLAQKCFWKRQHDQTAHEYTCWSECLHCLRIRVECTYSRDWSADTSVTCDQWNASQIILDKKSRKNAANKIHMSHVNASRAKKKKWETPKRNAAKCFIMCTFQDVKPTQETAGSGLNRLYNVLCLLWNIHSGALLPRIYSITNTKHWITYTYTMYWRPYHCLWYQKRDFSK